MRPPSQARDIPSPERSLPGALVDALSFPVLLGGTALAAYRSDFADQTVALVCGAAAVLFTRLYVNVIWSTQPSDEPKRAEMPTWAMGVYAVLGFALALLILSQGGGYAVAAMALAAGWCAGCIRLSYLWALLFRPETPKALHTIDDWLDTQAGPHGVLLARIGYAVSFALLFGSVARHAFESGFAHDAVMAALCGAAAILFVWLYAVITDAAHYTLVDSWKHVRPGPPPAELPRWVAWLHVLIGVAVFVAIAVLGGAPHEPGSTYIAVDAASGKERVILDGAALLALVLGWWLGGYVVLQFFWSRRRAALSAGRVKTNKRKG